MTDPRPSLERDRIENEAGAWVLRGQQRLAPAEKAEFAKWLAEDLRHREAFEELQRTWQRFDPLAKAVNEELAGDAGGTPHFARRVSHGHGLAKVVRWAVPALAAAAAIAIGITLWGSRRLSPRSAQTIANLDLPKPCELQVLRDGSVVELNRGAEIAVHYTPAARVIQFVRGDAHFTVAKNSHWPFVVTVKNVQVWAVGTAFEVRDSPTAVDVLVTEGKIKVLRNSRNPAAAPAAPQQAVFVSAGHEAVVAFGASAAGIQVSDVTPSEMKTRLAWRPRMLNYDDASLSEIVAEFNRHNPVRLRVADPALGTMPLSISFRSDNVEGFVRLMESNYGVRAARETDNSVVLSRK